MTAAWFLWCAAAAQTPVGVAEARPAEQQLAEPLHGWVAMTWRPRDGSLWVLCESGRRLRVFDALLRPREERTLEAGMTDVRSRGDHVLLYGETSDVYDAEGLPPRDSWRRWGLPRPDHPPEPAVPGPAGRRIRYRPEDGSLEFGLAPWEHGGEVEWGPGWATVRFRCVQPLGPYLQWRSGDGVLRLSPVRADAYDPLLQRAYLEPVAPGAAIELRHAPLTPRYPPREWSEWRAAAPAAVDPAGPRPVTVLP